MADDLNDALVHDHEEIDKPIAAYVVQSADASPAELKQAVAELRNHISWKKTCSIPLLAQAGMTIPCEGDASRACRDMAGTRRN